MVYEICTFNMLEDEAKPSLKMLKPSYKPAVYNTKVKSVFCQMSVLQILVIGTVVGMSQCNSLSISVILKYYKSP